MAVGLNLTGGLVTRFAKSELMLIVVILAMIFEDQIGIKCIYRTWSPTCTEF